MARGVMTLCLGADARAQPVERSIELQIGSRSTATQHEGYFSTRRFSLVGSTAAYRVLGVYEPPTGSCHAREHVLRDLHLRIIMSTSRR